MRTGPGKSTIVGAIAEAFKIDVRGGHGGRRYVSAEEVGVLSPLLRLVPPQGALHKTKSFFLRTETAKGVLEFMSDHRIEGYGERHAAEVSHGESFLQVFSGQFTERGLYLLDEPEAPFSFRSCLSLLAVLAAWAVLGARSSVPRTLRYSRRCPGLRSWNCQRRESLGEAGRSSNSPGTGVTSSTLRACTFATCLMTAEAELGRRPRGQARRAG